MCAAVRSSERNACVVGENQVAAHLVTRAVYLSCQIEFLLLELCCALLFCLHSLGFLGYPRVLVCLPLSLVALAVSLVGSHGGDKPGDFLELCLPVLLLLDTVALCIAAYSLVPHPLSLGVHSFTLSIEPVFLVLYTLLLVCVACNLGCHALLFCVSNTNNTCERAIEILRRSSVAVVPRNLVRCSVDKRKRHINGRFGHGITVVLHEFNTEFRAADNHNAFLRAVTVPPVWADIMELCAQFSNSEPLVVDVANEFCAVLRRLAVAPHASYVRAVIVPALVAVNIEAHNEVAVRHRYLILVHLQRQQQRRYVALVVNSSHICFQVWIFHVQVPRTRPCRSSPCVAVRQV